MVGPADRDNNGPSHCGKDEHGDLPIQGIDLSHSLPEKLPQEATSFVRRSLDAV
jgi:hypothetical protein